MKSERERDRNYFDANKIGDKVSGSGRYFFISRDEKVCITY